VCLRRRGSHVVRFRLAERPLWETEALDASPPRWWSRLGWKILAL
jgi:hypothetical protein